MKTELDNEIIKYLETIILEIASDRNLKKIRFDLTNILNKYQNLFNSDINSENYNPIIYDNNFFLHCDLNKSGYPLFFKYIIADGIISAFEVVNMCVSKTE